LLKRAKFAKKLKKKLMNDCHLFGQMAIVSQQSEKNTDFDNATGFKF